MSIWEGVALGFPSITWFYTAMKVEVSLPFPGYSHSRGVSHKSVLMCWGTWLTWVCCAQTCCQQAASLTSRLVRVTRVKHGKLSHLVWDKQIVTQPRLVFLIDTDLTRTYKCSRQAWAGMYLRKLVCALSLQFSRCSAVFGWSNVLVSPNMSRALGYESVSAYVIQKWKLLRV